MVAEIGAAFSGASYLTRSFVQYICLLYMVPDVVVVALHRIFVKVPRPSYFIASIKEPDAHASAAAEKVVYYRLHLVLLLRIEAVVVNCHYVAL